MTWLSGLLLMFILEEKKLPVEFCFNHRFLFSQWKQRYFITCTFILDTNPVPSLKLALKVICGLEMDQYRCPHVGLFIIANCDL